MGTPASPRIQMASVPYPDKYHFALRYFEASEDDTSGDGSHAQNSAPSPPQLPSETRLILYALKQQVASGPCHTEPPSRWNFVEKAKWDAWNSLGQIGQMEAMRLFIRTLDEENANWPSWDGLRELMNPSEGPVEPTELSPSTAGHQEDKTQPKPSPRNDGAPRNIRAKLTERGWCEVQPNTTDRPPPRFKHTATLVGNRLFVFGGTGIRGVTKALGRVWYLDLVSMEWVRPNVKFSNGDAGGESDSLPRASHTATSDGKRIVVFGGYNMETVLDSVVVFHTESMTWDLCVTLNHHESPSKPQPRSDHTCCLLGRELVVFGGETKVNGCTLLLSDTLLLDVDTWEWTRPSLTGNLPSGRRDHCAVAIGDDSMAIIGGFTDSGYTDDIYVFTKSNLTWSTPVMKGSAPSPRAGHSALSIDGNIIVFGGGNGEMGLNDSYFLSTGETPMRWERMMDGPGGREDFAAVIADSAFLVVGGYTGRYLSDIQGCDLAPFLPPATVNWSDIGGEGGPESHVTHTEPGSGSPKPCKAAVISGDCDFEVMTPPEPQQEVETHLSNETSERKITSSANQFHQPEALSPNGTHIKPKDGNLGNNCESAVLNTGAAQGEKGNSDVTSTSRDDMLEMRVPLPVINADENDSTGPLNNQVAPGTASSEPVQECPHPPAPNKNINTLPVPTIIASSMGLQPALPPQSPVDSMRTSGGDVNMKDEVERLRVIVEKKDKEIHLWKARVVELEGQVSSLTKENRTLKGGESPKGGWFLWR